MKVYIITADEYEDWDILSVHSTLAEAERVKANLVADARVRKMLPDIESQCGWREDCFKIHERDMEVSLRDLDEELATFP